MHFFHRDCETEIGNIFTQTDAFSKRKKITIPDWRKMKDLFKSFLMIYDFFEIQYDNLSFKSAAFLLSRVVMTRGYL